MNSIADQESQLQAQKLDDEEQQRQLGRQVRDLLERRIDMERNLLRQMEDLERQRTDFLRQQQRQWEEILFQQKELALQSQQLGVVMGNVAKGLDNAGQPLVDAVGKISAIFVALANDLDKLANRITGARPNTADRVPSIPYPPPQPTEGELNISQGAPLPGLGKPRSLRTNPQTLGFLDILSQHFPDTSRSKLDSLAQEAIAASGGVLEDAVEAIAEALKSGAAAAARETTPATNPETQTQRPRSIEIGISQDEAIRRLRQVDPGAIIDVPAPTRSPGTSAAITNEALDSVPTIDLGETSIPASEMERYRQNILGPQSSLSDGLLIASTALSDLGPQIGNFVEVLARQEQILAQAPEELSSDLSGQNLPSAEQMLGTLQQKAAEIKQARAEISDAREVEQELKATVEIARKRLEALGLARAFADRQRDATRAVEDQLRATDALVISAKGYLLVSEEIAKAGLDVEAQYRSQQRAVEDQLRTIKRAIADFGDIDESAEEYTPGQLAIFDEAAAQLIASGQLSEKAIASLEQARESGVNLVASLIEAEEQYVAIGQQLNDNVEVAREAAIAEAKRTKELELQQRLMQSTLDLANARADLISEPIAAARARGKTAELQLQMEQLQRGAEFQQLERYYSDNPEVLANIQLMRNNLEQLDRVKLDQIRRQADYLRESLIEIGVDGFGQSLDALGEVIAGTKSASQALVDVLGSLAQAVADFAKGIATGAFRDLLGGLLGGLGGDVPGFAPGSGAAPPLAPSGGFDVLGAFASNFTTGLINVGLGSVNNEIGGLFDDSEPAIAASDLQFSLDSDAGLTIPEFARGGLLGEIERSFNREIAMGGRHPRLVTVSEGELIVPPELARHLIDATYDPEFEYLVRRHHLQGLSQIPNAAQGANMGATPSATPNRTAATSSEPRVVNQVTFIDRSVTNVADGDELGRTKAHKEKRKLQIAKRYSSK